MKINNGKILVSLGIIHFLLGISPFVFGEQFLGFASKCFLKISEGLIEFPILKGEMNYENFAAFWFSYFGLMLIPCGFLLSYIEKENKLIPKTFIWSYLIVVLVGVYMIPFSGMTIFMLPHAIFMLVRRKNANSLTSEIPDV